jgi:hypothetical protein
MALDSNDRFIVATVTRGGIAEELNDHLERPEFRPDDDRLTDEVCRAYAEALGELDDHDPGFDEAYCALLDRLLGRLGIMR